MKQRIGKTNALYPSLTTILGTTINGRPNFITIAHVGIMNHGDPQYLSFGVSKAHFSNRGIMENKVFSVNIPSEDLVAETDYFGLMTGKNTDKSTVLETFFMDGYEAAPMLKPCPVTMICKLARTVDFETHDIFIGEIVATYADEGVLVNNKIDISRVKPLLFDMSSIQYWSLGEPVAGAWNIGKVLKKR
ncbi:MAG: flavin reductase family protein [Desulfobacula sp.]|jgi:flavin reductase (DIM6/NTAB) family NADH-FMN oxidoreductase RutF